MLIMEYMVALFTPEQRWGLLADAILAMHVAFVLFVVLGLPVIWLGALFKWRIARNRVFRFLHLGAMGVVLLETLLGMICPLTEWEAALRKRAGQQVYGDDTFMQYWLQKLLYWDWSHTTFILLYAGVFTAIVITYFAVPPHKNIRKVKAAHTQ